jgi:hypothetical protein
LNFNNLGAYDLSASERAELPLYVRRLPASLLLLINLLPHLTRPPRLIRDRNGRGRPYLKFWYWAAGRWRSVYAGCPDPNAEALVRRAITQRWPLTIQQLNSRIRVLRERRRMTRRAAQNLAAACGYIFRGYLLHKETGT